jgi:hypothetical protein
MTTLPPGAENAFQVASGELGMFSASRLFCRVLQETQGPTAIKALREELGTTFSVLDCVAARVLLGENPAPSVEALLSALSGCTKVLFVGVEVDCFDAILPRLSGKVGLLTENIFPADWRRVQANYPAVSLVSLSELPAWAGSKSALVAYVYGSNEHIAHVSPAWLRVSGPDVRAIFRSLIGWNLFGSA